MHDARLHVLKAGEGDLPLDGGFRHGEGVISSLEMVVGQNGAAHDGKIRVGAQEIVGEQLHEVKQLHEGILLDLHRRVLAVEHDAVLVVIHVGRILETPGAVVDRDRDDAVVVPGRMVGAPGVALVLPAEETFGIAALLRQLGGGDGLGVLLRLRQIDRDIQVAVLGGRHPLHILHDAVAPDVVGVLAQLVIVGCGRLRGGLIFLPELLYHLAGPGHQTVHKPGVKQIPVNDAVLDDALPAGIVQKLPKRLLQVYAGKLLLRLLILIQF